MKERCSQPKEFRLLGSLKILGPLSGGPVRGILGRETTEESLIGAQTGKKGITKKVGRIRIASQLIG